MKRILTSFSLVVASLAFAQVGINVTETEIAPDALFHVKNKNNEAKGVILPKVTLTSETDQTTITGGAVTTGLMVWNNGSTSGLNPAGYYYWDGAKWILTGNVDDTSSGVTTPFPTSRTVVESPNDITATLANNPDVLVIRLVGTGAVILPDASLYPGKIISLNNETGGNATYASGTIAGLTTTIRVASAHLLWSDGTSWWCLSSRNG